MGIELRIEHSSGFTSRRRQQASPMPPLSKPDAVTDAGGAFCVPAKSWTNAVAWFTGDGWSPRVACLHRASPRNGEGEAAPLTEPPSEELEVALQRAARVEGTVTGATGPTAARATFPGYGLAPDHHTAEWIWPLVGKEFQVESTVDPSGSFLLAGLPTGAELTLSLVSSTTRKLLLQDAEPLRLDHSIRHDRQR